MKYREAIPGLLVLVLRLALVPAVEWLRDWISVLAVIWIGITLSPAESRSRGWVLAAGCVWLALIYGYFQGGFTLAGFR
jgi:hypothetical protein